MSNLKVGEVWAHVDKKTGDPFRIFLVVSINPVSSLILRLLPHEQQYVGRVTPETTIYTTNTEFASFRVERLT